MRIHSVLGLICVGGAPAFALIVTIGTHAASAETIADGSALSAPQGMLLVPAGEFVMGADAGGEGDEHPAHLVTLRAFLLDETEVTNQAYGECVQAKVCRPKSPVVVNNPHGFNLPLQPVSGVSWDDADAYCKWRGERLPTEAEFEHAVRDSDGRRYPWGDAEPTLSRAVFAGVRPEPVGKRKEGRGPYGHHDLAGNVWEWTSDYYDPFAYARAGAGRGVVGTCEEIKAAEDTLRAQKIKGFTGSNPIPEGCDRAIRGGAYNYDAFGLRATNRVHHPGNFRIPMLGFRCAKDVAEDAATGGTKSE